MLKSQHPAIILVGKTGAGKSTLANRLHNLLTGNTNEVFKVSDGTTTETKDAHTETIVLGGEIYDLVDLPGFHDTSGTDANTIKEITRVIMSCAYGVQAVLFLIEYRRMTSESSDAVSWIKRTFGPYAMANVILVFSKVNKKLTINREQFRKKLEEDSIEDSERPLKDLVKDVKNRWIISPNPDIFESPDDEYWRRETDHLFEQIQSLKKPYTNETFRQYREKVDLIEAKRRCRAEKDEAEIQKIKQEMDKAVEKYKAQIESIKQNAIMREKNNLNELNELNNFATTLGIAYIAATAAGVTAVAAAGVTVAAAAGVTTAAGVTAAAAAAMNIGMF